MNTPIDTLQQFSQPLARGLLASLFLAAGLGKISGYAGTLAYMQAMGVPGAVLPGVIVLEIGGALALILGWQARLTAFLLAGFSLLSALLFHADFSDATQQVMFLKNLSIAGGLLLVFAHGAGAWSLDTARSRRLQAPAAARNVRA